MYCQSDYSCNKKKVMNNFLTEEEVNYKKRGGKSAKILVCFECRKKSNEHSKNYREEHKQIINEKYRLNSKIKKRNTAEKSKRYRRNNLIKCILRSCLTHDNVYKLMDFFEYCL